MYCLLRTVGGSIVKMHDLSRADNPILASALSSHKSTEVHASLNIAPPKYHADSMRAHTHLLLRDCE